MLNMTPELSRDWMVVFKFAPPSPAIITTIVNIVTRGPKEQQTADYQIKKSPPSRIRTWPINIATARALDNERLLTCGLNFPYRWASSVIPHHLPPQRLCIYVMHIRLNTVMDRTDKKDSDRDEGDGCVSAISLSCQRLQATIAGRGTMAGRESERLRKILRVF